MYVGGRYNFRPLVFLHLVSEMACVVRGLQARLGGNGPDLEEMDRNALFVRVLLRVRDSGTGGGKLDVSSGEDFSVRHRVFAVYDSRRTKIIVRKWE